MSIQLITEQKFTWSIWCLCLLVHCSWLCFTWPTFCAVKRKSGGNILSRLLNNYTFEIQDLCAKQESRCVSSVYDISCTDFMTEGVTRGIVCSRRRRWVHLVGSMQRCCIRRYIVHFDDFDVQRHIIPPTKLFAAWEAIGTIMLEDKIVA